MLAVNPSGAGPPFSTMKVLPLEVMIAFGVLRKFPNFGDRSRSTPHRDRVIGALGLKVPDAARTRRRGDRITEINPLGMSLPGTKRKSRGGPTTSAVEGKNGHAVQASQLATLTRRRHRRDQAGRRRAVASLTPRSQGTAGARI